MTVALLLIDIQNDYFPEGRMVVEGSVEASVCAEKLLSYFRERTMPVVHVQHLSVRSGAAFLLPGTRGSQFHARVTPLDHEAVIEKNYPNSFRNTDLLEHLKTEGISHVAICGMMTHMCVDATVRAAFDYGFTCSVASDACATRALTFDDRVVPADHVHAAFLAALSGVYAKVATTERIIASLK
jgi:nicotinamidase-related amidase